MIEALMTCVAVHGESNRELLRDSLEKVFWLEKARKPTDEEIEPTCDVHALFQGPDGTTLEYHTSDWDKATQLVQGKSYVLELTPQD